jgi:DNA-binding response OmpR family regulator
MPTADLLREFGCETSAVFDIKDANAAIDDRLPDVAVLDVNIGGETSYSIAHRLHRHAIPIVFLTGYETPSVEGPWSQHPVCRKPCDADKLKELLIAALVTRRDQQKPSEM